MNYKKCGHCGKTFICNAADIKNCHCYGVELSKAAAALAQQAYPNCLCNACLKEFVQKEQAEISEKHL